MPATSNSASYAYALYRQRAVNMIESTLVKSSLLQIHLRFDLPISDFDVVGGALFQCLELAHSKLELTPVGAMSMRRRPFMQWF
jgi:hypothetical protein